VQGECTYVTFEAFELNRTPLHVKPILTQSERIVVPQEIEIHSHLGQGRFVISVASNESDQRQCHQGKSPMKRGT